MRKNGNRCGVTAGLCGIAVLCACGATRLELSPPVGVTGADWLETLRAEGTACRAATPARPVGGVSPTAAEAKRFLAGFLATGEAEELDFWNVADARAPHAALCDVRKLLDGAGGGAVRLLVDGAPWSPFAVGGLPASALLLTGSGRILVKEPNGRERVVKTGCGNVHRALSFGGWIWYSNGALWRVREGAAPETPPELVWRSPKEKGAAVLGFDRTPEGFLAMAVNATDEVVVYDPTARRVVRRFAVNACGADGKTLPPHAHLRMIHATSAGTYLVSCAGAGAAREYDRDGRCVWEQTVPGGFVFDAKRLSDGHTLVSHLDGLTEFTSDHRAVWRFSCSDAPALKLKFLCAVQEDVAAGAFLVGTWANGTPAGTRTTAFAVSRADRRILWSFASREDTNMMGVTGVACER